MSFTNPGAAAMLNAFFRGSSGTTAPTMTRTTGLFLGLSSSQSPSQGGTPSAANEIPNVGGYARQPLGGSTFGSADAGGVSTITNAQMFTFPQATASWGMVAGAFIATNSSVGQGTVLFVFSGMTPRTINANDSLTIPVGDLIATLD